MLIKWSFFLTAFKISLWCVVWSFCFQCSYLVCCRPHLPVCCVRSPHLESFLLCFLKQIFIPCLLSSNFSLAPINLRLVFSAASSCWMNFSCPLTVLRVSLSISSCNSTSFLISETLSSHWSFLLFMRLIEFFIFKISVWHFFHGVSFFGEFVIHVLNHFGQLFQFFIYFSHTTLVSLLGNSSVFWCLFIFELSKFIASL